MAWLAGDPEKQATRAWPRPPVAPHLRDLARTSRMGCVTTLDDKRETSYVWISMLSVCIIEDERSRIGMVDPRVYDVGYDVADEDQAWSLSW